MALAPITNDVLALFLRENFDEPEGELEECAPTDWAPMVICLKTCFNSL